MPMKGGLVFIMKSFRIMWPPYNEVASVWTRAVCPAICECLSWRRQSKHRGVLCDLYGVLLHYEDGDGMQIRERSSKDRH